MFERVIAQLDALVWAAPLILLIFASAAYYTVRMGFV